MGANSDLTLQADILSGSFNPDPIKLATLEFAPIVVPGLPVWVTPEVSVFVGAKGDISSTVTTEVSAAGTFSGGVTYASGTWTPVPLSPSFQFAYTPPTLDVGLSAKAYAGIEFDLYVYDLVGPSFKPDGYLDLEADISKDPWWQLTAGIEGPMSLDLNFLGENLASYDLGTMFDYSHLIASAPGPFLPSVSIISLSFNPTSIGPGASSTGTITLSGAAPAGGALVALAASNPSLLSVPANVTVPAGSNTCTFTATSSATLNNSTQVIVTASYNSSQNASVTLNPVVVTVIPPTAQVVVKGLQQFNATVANISNTAVTWSVNGVIGGNATAGTVSTNGLYAAPATIPTPATVTVTATTQATPVASGSASVTIGPYNETPVYSFTSLNDGAAPSAPMIQASDGFFYGTAQVGGANGYGTVFKVDSTGLVTPLHEFSGIDGAYPNAALVQDSSGNFYGTTYAEGNTSCTAVNNFTGCGSVFKMDSTGAVTTLHLFSGGSEGAGPLGAGLVIGADGYLYGTTYFGGTSNSGTVFKMDLSGNLTTLYSFSGGTDGYGPDASLIQANDGYFYGTTEHGGVFCGVGPGSNCGTIFKIDSSGNLATLYSFTGGADGADPDEALMQASDGYFYGTTVFGGDPSCSVSTYTGCGTIFKMDSNGNFTTMHEFSGGIEGGVPFSSLIQATDGDFYGTATAGGDPSCSVTAAGFGFPTYIGCGTVFKMDSVGNVSALYSFTGTPNDGSNPFAAVVEGNDGYLYGTTRWGGADTTCPYTDNGGCGTVFKVSGPGGPLPLLPIGGSQKSLSRILTLVPITPRPAPIPNTQRGQRQPHIQGPRGLKEPMIVK
jgi:uncharacterized repeat protein (TIGR03803 family)